MKRLCPVFVLLAALATLGAPYVGGQGLPTAVPAAVGLSAPALARMDADFQGCIDRGELPGVVTLIMRKGRVAHFQAQGWLDAEAKRPMRQDAIFRIKSMTKLVTSVAILMLYEEGKLTLNSPVSKFIPAFKDVRVAVFPPAGTPPGETLATEPARREITIRDLLTHTAGLTYGEGYGTLDKLYKKAGIVLESEPLAVTVDRLAHLPLAFQPGTKWEYSQATFVLGRVVEVASGLSLDRFFGERIFKPLGMPDTGFVIPEAKVDRLTTHYAYEGGALKAQETAQASRYRKPRLGYNGGGGLLSTAQDYARFLQMLLNQGELEGVRLLSRKTVELMTTNQLTGIPPHMWFRPGIGFGLGVAVLVDPGQTGELGTPGNFWWAGYFNTVCLVDPKAEMVGVFLTQVLPFGHLGVMNRFQQWCEMVLE